MDISIIEFLVYAIVGYSPLIVLYVTLIKEAPASKAGTIQRVIFIIPGLIAVGVLAGSGLNINMEFQDTTTNSTVYNVTGNYIMTNSTVTSQTTDKFILENPVWTLFHTFLFTLYSFYIIIQILQLLSFKN